MSKNKIPSLFTYAIQNRKNQTIPQVAHIEDNSLPLAESSMQFECIDDQIFNTLTEWGAMYGLNIKIKPLYSHDSVLYKNRIAIRDSLGKYEKNYEAAYELGHFFLHKFKVVGHPEERIYVKEAEAFADAVTKALYEVFDPKNGKKLWSNQHLIARIRFSFVVSRIVWKDIKKDFVKGSSIIHSVSKYLWNDIKKDVTKMSVIRNVSL